MKSPSTDWHDTLGSMLSAMGAESESDAADPQMPQTPTHPAFPLQKLRIDIEKKGRGGKTATIISGFTVDDSTVANIAASLKKRLGTGGSARGGEILIQGDRRDEVKELLRQLGLTK